VSTVSPSPLRLRVRFGQFGVDVDLSSKRGPSEKKVSEPQQPINTIMCRLKYDRGINW